MDEIQPIRRLPAQANRSVTIVGLALLPPDEAPRIGLRDDLGGPTERRIAYEWLLQQVPDDPPTIAYLTRPILNALVRGGGRFQRSAARLTTRSAPIDGARRSGTTAPVGPSPTERRHDSE
jgi:hypothetical protein